MACLIMAISLILIRSFSSASSESQSPAELIAVSEGRMQSKIDALSFKVSDLSQVVLKLQSQTQEKNPDSLSNLPALSELESIQADSQNLARQVASVQSQVTEMQEKVKTAELDNLNTRIAFLLKQVADLQDKLKGADTMVGISPISVNGVSVAFITNDIEIPLTGSSVPSTAQFAIKIINVTNSPLTNVDVTGTITSSRSFYEVLSSTYPQLSDGAGLCSYVFYLKGSILHFEAFSNAKTNLTIPAGGSITLRPKLAVLTAADEEFSTMTLHITLKTVTYDRAPTK